MSQPPQPPNTPPQGGFGAPQSGYGYPQAPQGPGTPPPPQQGYGYPQAPGQPPSTPPAGGPYTPPPPPPGAPQTPPPPPGVPQTPPPPGAPQTPPPGAPGPVPPPPPGPQTPPPGAGGYGYPAQPGYGYPQPTHAQPTQVGMPTQPYGMPQQPYGTYPTQTQPPVGGGSGGGSKQRLVIIISAVVALLLIVAGGIFFLTKDDGGDDQGKKGDSGGTSQGATGGNDDPTKKKSTFKPTDAPETIEARLLGTLPKPKNVKSFSDVPGLWATDEVFAKAGLYNITAYPADGGKPKWKLPLDGALCAGWQGVTKEGLTAVVFQDHKPKKKDDYPDCTEVGLVNLKTGKLVWQKHVGSGDYMPEFDEVTIGAGTVAAGGTRGGAAWSVDGKELWVPRDGTECKDQGYFGTEEKLIAVQSCGDYGNENVRVQSVNPTTGETVSRFDVPRGIEYVRVVSADPLVIALSAAGDDSGISDLMVLDDKSAKATLRSKISTSSGKYTIKCSTEVASCGQVAVSKETDTLFMATEARSSDASGSTNEIVAFSLATGKTIGKSDGLPGSEIVPMGVDQDGYVLALQKAGYTSGGGMWRVNPESYKKDQLMRLPSESAEGQNTFDAGDDWFVYNNQHLYMGDTVVSDSDYDAKDPLAMAFGR